jgi:hypothetical protein
MESWKPHTHDYGVKDVKNWKKPFDWVPVLRPDDVPDGCTLHTTFPKLIDCRYSLLWDFLHLCKNCFSYFKSCWWAWA